MPRLPATMHLIEQNSRYIGSRVVSDSSGAIGAPADRKLHDESKAAAHPLGSHQDALNFASHGVENSDRALAANNLINVIERYRKGNCGIYAELITGPGATKYDLVSLAIPMGGEKRAPKWSGANPNACRKRDGDKHFMFGGVRKLVECLEGVIPSLVRLERHKNRRDFRWQILASTLGVVPHLRLKLAPWGICRT